MAGHESLKHDQVALAWTWEGCVMGDRSGSSLTPRQARFVKEYLVDLNGTQAAIRAGYSASGADVQAVRLLGNARVKAGG